MTSFSVSHDPRPHGEICATKLPVIEQMENLPNGLADLPASLTSRREGFARGTPEFQMTLAHTTPLQIRCPLPDHDGFLDKRS